MTELIIEAEYTQYMFELPFPKYLIVNQCFLIASTNLSEPIYVYTMRNVILF